MISRPIATRLEMNLSQTRSALGQARVRPMKSLGQNFLHDQNLARWIVDQAEVQANDFVLEIGPGLGALSEKILARGARLLALEKDARLVEFLRAKIFDSRFDIRHCDALDFDERVLFTERNAKLIANLPYYLASQLLVKYLDYPSCIWLAVLMLQDEMARRVCAQPGSGDYGALSLRVQLHYAARYLRKIPRTVFLPQPDIASAIIHLQPRAGVEYEIIDYELCRELIRRGFSQRRKQLRNLLFDSPEQWRESAKQIDASPTARAEELSREQWIELSNSMARTRISAVTDDGTEQFAVVDKNDRKIGAAARKEVHGNNLLHRAVHVFIFKEVGELLLQKRSASKDRHPLLWDSSAAGHVSANESYDETAARELAEELGIQCQLHLIGKIPASEKTGHEFIQLYRCEHHDQFSPNRSEIAATKFFPLDIIDRWIKSKPEDFAPGFLECWTLFQAHQMRRR